MATTTPLNVRPKPRDYSKKRKIGILKKNSIVIVEDLRIALNEKKVPQIWIRVSVDKGAITKPALTSTSSPTVPPEETAPSAPVDDAPEATLDPVAKKILGCYKAQVAGDKTTTIRRLFECSGRWVTPRALLACSMGANCAKTVLGDTIDGRAIVEAQLAANMDGLKKAPLTIDSELKLSPAQIPRLPDAAEINACRGASASTSDFSECIAGSLSKKYDQLFQCFTRLTDGEQNDCLQKQVNNADFTRLMDCLAGGKPTTSKITVCVTDAKLRDEIETARSCVEGKTGQAARSCLLVKLPPQQREIATCLEKLSESEDPSACMDTLSPEIKKFRAVAACRKFTDKLELAKCVAPHVSTDVAKIAACAGEKDKVALAACVLGDSKELQAAQRIQRCLAGGRTATAMLVNCTDGVLDDKSRTAIACVAEAGTDRVKLANCAAGAVLPKDAARVVSCAANSTGPTSFALCAAGPAMNEEWRIAAECAVQSGGNPVGFAGCTAGRLTVREFTKCFTGEIGKDCFGPNNTIVKGLNDAFNDITKGPGRNNEIVKLIGAVENITGGSNSVINNPSQIWGGDNSVFNNPGQIFGGSGSVFNDPGQVVDPRRWRW
ncbi:hypothetical protein IHQ68_07370 [Chelatococcus sambhunathii]|uniref:Cysteine rich repeat n=1 Tax=Chelatococcus sambhunathii TaxID=363953 RepID=A0ABU1DEA0_9HYPH|nr:hypothetical protein [Chelatococcus sambhunathii]MDR4306435.1 hypothetical protein [Chelatococcus sambhunathii]